MIYLIFLQYMKHRTQIMQERSAYDLTTNTIYATKRLHHSQKVTVTVVTNT